MSCVVTTLSFILIISLVVSQNLHGDKYQKLPALKKADIIYQGLVQNPHPGEYYSTAQTAEIFVEDANTSFDTSADDMPYQFLGLEKRKKLIHSVGAMAEIEWTVEKNDLNLTGIFAEGSKVGFIRFSSASKPVTSGNVTSLAAGIAIKLLRDGAPSVNTVALHDLTNHVPNLNTSSDPVMKLLLAKFMTASDFPVFVGLCPWAEVDANGNKVKSPKFPFRLVFHPTTSWHNAFDDAYPGVPFYAQLAKSLKPGPLYEVYALMEPSWDNQDAVRIATISLRSPVLPSVYGDRTIFIQHIRFEDDLKYRPDWATPAKQIMEEQANSKTPFSYPDLPWV